MAKPGPRCLECGLKRHRDLRYDDDDDKPISIIITTLAAKAYRNERDLGSALLNVVPGMRHGIELREGKWWVPNPVDPRENFADKWNETPRKYELFRDWLQAVETEHRALLNSLGPKSGQTVARLLCESYGADTSKGAIEKFARRNDADTFVLTGPRNAQRFSIAYRENPLWPIYLKHRVTISGRATRNGFTPFAFENGSTAITKHCSLSFAAHTDVPRPFQVFWQVVNTGAEAERAKCLRGDRFYQSGPTHDEITLYRGMHWVECFVVKDGMCIARSAEFVVNVQ
ncbi:MAG: hypothetical protein KF878_01240 [Planctomycetes bacterium]|nr:hypothetical protein [Planctomycetota bacterium]